MDIKQELNPYSPVENQVIGGATEPITYKRRLTKRKLKIILPLLFLAVFIPTTIFLIFKFAYNSDSQDIRSEASRIDGISLSFEPATVEVTKGETQTIDIILDNASDAIAAVKIAISYDANSVSIENLQADTALPVVLEQPLMHDGFAIITIGANLGNPLRERAKVASFQIRSIEGIGSKIIFDQQSAVASFNQEGNALARADILEIKIKQQPSDWQPPFPSGLNYSCSPSGDRVTLTWDPIPMASGFLFRLDHDGNNKNGGWFVPNSTDIKDDDVQGNSYQARVIPNQLYRWWLQTKVKGQVVTGAVSQQFTCQFSAPESAASSGPTGDKNQAAAEPTIPDSCETDSDCPSGQTCYQPTPEARDGRMPAMYVLKYCK